MVDVISCFIVCHILFVVVKGCSVFYIVLVLLADVFSCNVSNVGLWVSLYVSFMWSPSLLILCI
jgi:hypothetical protein